MDTFLIHEIFNTINTLNWVVNHFDTNLTFAKKMDMRITSLILLLFTSTIAYSQIAGNSLKVENANNAYITIPDAASASLNDEMTWEFWIYYKCENGNNEASIFTKGWCGDIRSYDIWITNGMLSFQKFSPLQNGNCANTWTIYSSDNKLIPNNTWSHIAIVQSGTTIQFYLNGQAVNTNFIQGTPSIGIKSTSQPILLNGYRYIGGSYGGGHIGNLDEVRIWHTARTQAEINATKNVELNGNENYLVAYYKLNETGNGSGITCLNSAVGSLIPSGTTVGSAGDISFINNSFVPNLLPICNPRVWYKADSGVYIDNGSTLANNGESVQQWNDISGNGFHFRQTNASQKPTLSVSALNGKPSISFDGSDLLRTISQINWNNTLENDIFIVCKNIKPNAMLLESSPDVNNNNGSLYIIDNYTTGAQGIACAMRGANAGFRIYKNYNGFIPCAKVYQVTFDMNQAGTNSIKVKLNNNNLNDNNGYNAGQPGGGFNTHYLYAGSRSDNTEQLQGYISEIIVYPYKLSLENAEQVYNYLNTKYFSGNGIAQFNGIPSSPKIYSNNEFFDDSWRHTYNSSMPNEIIASVKDNCIDLGARHDTVYTEPTAIQIGDAHALRRHYIVKTTLNPAGMKRVRLYYSNDDFADLQSKVPYPISHNTLAVTKYNGPNEDGIFDKTGGTTTYIPPAQISYGTAFGSNYVEFEVNGFSEFWIHPQTNIPLPVNLIQFSVNKCKQNDACISWKVEEENYFKNYEIEKSRDGISFEFLKSIPAENLKSYSIVDPNQNGTIYYRLKMNDENNSFKYSKVEKLNFDKATNIQIIPNPSKGNFEITGLENTNKFEILNLQGQIIYQKENLKQDKIQVSIQNLAPGIYILKTFQGITTQSEKLTIF